MSEAEAAAIRAVYEQRGELSAAVELRRRFPGIVDNVQARECAASSRVGSRPPRRTARFFAPSGRGCRTRSAWVTLGEGRGAEPGSGRHGGEE